MKSKFFLYGFITISIVESIGILLANPMLTVVFKPLIVLSLIGYYYYSAEQPITNFIGALLFCWVGDVLLIFQDRAELFFILGLVCFLAGHVLFIFVYRKSRWKEDVDQSLLGTQKTRIAFPIILAGTGLIVTLYPYLGNMKIPVMVYVLIITLMVLNASYRYGRTSIKSYWLVLGGAFLFMVSDTLLALNKFREPIHQADFYIMITYMGAQFSIVEGISQHPKIN